MYKQIFIINVCFILICVLSTNGFYCNRETPMEVLYTNFYTFFPIKSAQLIYFTVQTNGSAKILLKSSPKFVFNGEFYYYEICVGCKVDNEIRTELRKNGRTKISVASKALSTSEVTSFYIAWHPETKAILVGRDKVVSLIWYDTEGLGLLPFNYFGIRSDSLDMKETDEFSKWTIRPVKGNKEIAAWLSQQMDMKEPVVHTDSILPEFEKPELSRYPISEDIQEEFSGDNLKDNVILKEVVDHLAKKATEENQPKEEKMIKKIYYTKEKELPEEL